MWTSSPSCCQLLWRSNIASNSSLVIKPTGVSSFGSTNYRAGSLNEPVLALLLLMLITFWSLYTQHICSKNQPYLWWSPRWRPRLSERRKKPPKSVSLDLKPPYPNKVIAKQFPQEYEVLNSKSLMIAKATQGACGLLPRLYRPFSEWCRVMSSRISEITNWPRIHLVYQSETKIYSWLRAYGVLSIASSFLWKLNTLCWFGPYKGNT